MCVVAGRDFSSCMSLRATCPEGLSTPGQPDTLPECQRTLGRVTKIFYLAACITQNLAVAKKARKTRFDPKLFLATIGGGRTVADYRKGEVVFSQGDPADAVFYVQKGKVKILVTSEQGKEAVVAIVGTGEFFAEGCLVAQPLRLATGSAMTESTVMRLAKEEMVRLLHKEPEFAELFTAHLLTRNSRVEEDLVDQLFNSSEKRLARITSSSGEFRQGRQARADHDQDQPGDACGDGRYNSASCQFVHEQVQEIGLYRIQRQPGSA